MSLESFKLTDDTSTDTSIIKQDSINKYHLQGAQLFDSNQSADLLFEEKNIYHQITYGDLELDETLRKNGANFTFVDGNANTDEPIRLI